MQQNFEERERREEEVTEEEAEKEKRSTLGNVVFIGELYKEHILPDIVMHLVVKSLLQQATTTAPPTPTDTESKSRRMVTDLEALCVLFTTIGAVFDKRKDRDIDGYFKQVGQLSKNKNVPSRVRCRLMDLIELRQKRWQQRA